MKLESTCDAVVIKRNKVKKKSKSTLLLIFFKLIIKPIKNLSLLSFCTVKSVFYYMEVTYLKLLYIENIWLNKFKSIYL